MNTIIPDSPGSLRVLLLIPVGIAISLALLALMPFLLRQTALRGDHPIPLSTRLIPLEPEQRIEPREEFKEPEPEPPPPEPEEPELRPDPPEAPELAPPEIETPEIAPPEIETPRAAIDPMEIEPPPLQARVETPSIETLALNGPPIRSSPLNLKVNLRPNKAPPPRALPGPKSPARPPAPRVRYGLDEVDRKPTPVSSMRPIYPYRARRLSMEGYVTVRFLVDRDGGVRELSLLESKPGGVFDRSVRKTVSRWRFKPAMKDGKPVETWVKTTIHFQLEGG